MLANFDLTTFLISMFVLVFAIGLHEYGHAKLADLAGDDTPRLMGRVTLNPLKHLDPIGSIMIVLSSLTGFGIGWGKPVMVRPDRMRNPRWDDFYCALAGPVMNFLQAIAYALAFRLLTAGDPSALGGFAVFLAQLFFLGTFINVSLMLFNLIPLGPLDGHWILGAFLPEPTRLEWFRFNRGIGSMVFLILVLVPSGSSFDLLGRFFFPLVARAATFLLGTHG